MIRTIAVDDEPLALEVIKTFCSKFDFLELKTVFTETNMALKYIEEHPVDLIFLDINMPALSGIDLYKRVPKNVMAIFTTAYGEYAVEGFNLNAVDYLLKPVAFGRFKKAVEKAYDYYMFSNQKESVSGNYLFVNVDYSKVKIMFNDILYIEGLDNYVKFHFNNHKTQLVRMSMKAVTEKLPPNEFVRVHRSYIIPLSKVTLVRNKTIYLDQSEIPIGTNYVEQVQKLLKGV